LQFFAFSVYEYTLKLSDSVNERVLKIKMAAKRVRTLEEGNTGWFIENGSAQTAAKHKNKQNMAK